VRLALRGLRQVVSRGPAFQSWGAGLHPFKIAPCADATAV